MYIKQVRNNILQKKKFTHSFHLNQSTFMQTLVNTKLI